MAICGQPYEYDARICHREPGHLDDGYGGDVHEAADGYRWIHHEQIYAEGTPDEGVETWDEPYVDGESERALDEDADAYDGRND